MARNNKDHQMRIEALEQLAADVLALKKQHRQRRPIIIEFCGSPKAGKTSCINSLNIFLKRNGFKTAILSERAGFSPISDKYNPVFNVWTCTSAINEINKKMDRAQHGEELDVIISDRGIFDALCWFKWLKTQEHMNEKEYKVLTEFATLYRWTKNIDLVYVFMVSPEVSIQREYANLLTNKRGSIMCENVLEQYLESVKETMDEYKKVFRAVHQIETTNMAQNDVGYEVTINTLQMLKDMLIEKVGYVSKESLPLDEGFNDVKTLLPKLDRYSFAKRNLVEQDSAVIQPIPIAVFLTPKEDKLLCLKKTKKSTTQGSPERGRLLFYAGGHTRIEDEISEHKADFLKTAQNTLEREMFEELGISISLEGKSPAFCLYTPQFNETSKHHLAVGWFVHLTPETKLHLDSYEMVQKKGSSKSGNFLSFAEIEKTFSDDKHPWLESWSKEILLKFFRDRFSTHFIDSIEKATDYYQFSISDYE